MTRWLALLSLGAVGCGLLAPSLDPLVETPRVVEVTEAWTVPTEGLLPTDLEALPDGGFAVLDGYHERLFLFDGDRRQAGILEGAGSWSQVVRMAPATGGGWWLAAPEEGAVLQVGATGAVERLLPVAGETPDAVPVAVREVAGHLAVGLRTGGIRTVDPETGAVLTTRETDVDGLAFGSISDLVVAPDGGLHAADALGHKVHLLSPEGAPTSWFGRLGYWIGYLSKPKGLALGPEGTVLVADTALGAVQLFTAEGAPLGVLAGPDGIALRFEHPIAVEPLGSTGETFAVLDAGTATVHGLTLTSEALAEAQASVDLRHLRHPLADPHAAGAGLGGALCLECHDGTVNDDRHVWDATLSHHPYDIVPDRELPAFFPLEDGRLVCGSCHSPHGLSTLEEVQGVEGEEGTGHLIRHASPGDLFTRVGRERSELCLSCHEDAAHETLLESLGLEGTRGHPVGSALVEALGAREAEPGPAGLPAGIDGGCLSCHATHGAEGPGLLSAAAVEGEACLSCHPDQARAGLNHPLGAEVAAHVPARAHEVLPIGRRGHTCGTCHDLVEGRGTALVRAPGGSTGALCASCHDPAYLRGPHGRVHGAQDLSCLGCHDLHGAPTLLSTLSAAGPGDPQGCMDCHRPEGVAGASGVHPGVHGHPVALEGLECSSCHPSAHHPDRDLATCGSCHEVEHEAEGRGGHGGLECAACHPVHTESPPDPAYADVNPRSARCLSCHAPGEAGARREVEAWDHPTPVFLPDGTRWTPLGHLPLFDAEGEALPPGENGDLTCSSCHLTHGPHDAQPADKLRRPGWREACASCHGQEALVLYRYFHQPARRGEGNP